MRNVNERAILLSGNKVKIDTEHLALPRSLAATPASTDKITLTFDREPTLAELEQSYLKLLLERRPGSRADLARIMGIGERTLYRLLADLEV